MNGCITVSCFLVLIIFALMITTVLFFFYDILDELNKINREIKILIDMQEKNKKEIKELIFRSRL
jgi:hypothetical protein